MKKVLLGLGSNLGNRVNNLKTAIKELEKYGRVGLTSFMYETDPCYVTEQPSFLNMAVELTTNSSPQDLLAQLKTIEKNLGRVQTIPKGPRVIDIDILTYENSKIVTDILTIPHASMKERDFVIKPLMDINPFLEIDGQRIQVNSI